MVLNPAEQFAQAIRDKWAERLRLRRALLDGGITQAEVAKRADVSQGTVAKLESASMWPSDVLKVRIAWALEMKPGDLWNWDRI